MRLLFILTASCVALFVSWLTQTRSEVNDHSAERLFRQKCFRCHGADLTMRPVQPRAIDSLVRAMRKYDTLWISPQQACTISQYMKQTLPKHNSPILSQ